MPESNSYVASPRKPKPKRTPKPVTEESVMSRVKMAESQHGGLHQFRNSTLDQIVADGKAVGIKLDLSALRS